MNGFLAIFVILTNAPLLSSLAPIFLFRHASVSSTYPGQSVRRPFVTLSDFHSVSGIGRLSCFSEFFVRFHIVCDRYTSYYAHFTFSDTI